MLSNKLACLFHRASSRPASSSSPAGAHSRIAAAGPSVLATLAFAALLVLWAVAGRWFLETPNFKSVGAAALLAGLLLRDWRFAIAVPLTSLAISDWWLGGYEWSVAATVYGSTCLYTLLGTWAKGRTRTSSAAAVSQSLLLCIAGSLQFFLLTNFAFWMWSGCYGPGWSELVRCFVSAIPFYKWTLLSDLTFFAAPLVVWELLGRPLFSRYSGSASWLASAVELKAPRVP